MRATAKAGERLARCDAKILSGLQYTVEVKASARCVWRSPKETKEKERSGDLQACLPFVDEEQVIVWLDEGRKMWLVRF